MMSFWIFAALLIAIALCYVLPPLLERVASKVDDRQRANVSIYRDQFEELERDLRDGVLDQEQYEQGRLDLQRRLLEDVAPGENPTAIAASPDNSRKATAIFVGAAIPLSAVLLYYQIGTPRALAPSQPTVSSRVEAEAPGAPVGMPGQPTQEEIESRVAKLEARLKADPTDGAGWAMLARSYQSFERYQEAISAYERATKLAGNDPQLWVDYAETLALTNDSQLQGRPLELINRALQLNPNNEKALWLAGHAASQTRNFQQAITYWEKLEKLLPGGSEGARIVSAKIDEARAQIAGK